MNANIATNVGKSRVDIEPDDEDHWDFEGALGLGTR